MHPEVANGMTSIAQSAADREGMHAITTAGIVVCVHLENSHASPPYLDAALRTTLLGRLNRTDPADTKTNAHYGESALELPIPYYARWYP